MNQSHSPLLTEVWSQDEIAAFPLLDTTGLQSHEKTLSDATKALQGGRKSLNFSLLHPLLPWKLVGEMCSSAAI